MSFPPERRQGGKFTEKLSMFMVGVAALGAFWVLIDPQMKIETWGISFGGVGFSADLKGAVISAILIGGWTAVKEFWLGASAGGQHQAESMSRIAEAAGPAAAVAAAGNQELKADDVQVTAEGDVTVTKAKKKR